MNQLVLFSRARRRDPLTSHLAAERLDATRQTNLLYEYICKHPGLTAGELEQQTGAKAHKRCPELRARGLVKNGLARVCSVSGFMAMTWFALEPVERAA